MMKAVVLAAGMGIRLDHLTNMKPKAMVRVAGRLLLEHTIGFLRHPKINKIAVVGGYHFGQVEDYIRSHYGDEITIYKNERYREGNILSIKAAFDFLDDDVLICNVDHIYPSGLMDYIAEKASGITAMCDRNRRLGKDDMKVKLDSEGFLKDISKGLREFEMGYIGMTFCAKEMLQIYKSGVLDVISKNGSSACIESVLDHLAKHGTKIGILDTSGFKWYEVDTPSDIKIAEDGLKEGF